MMRSVFRRHSEVAGVRLFGSRAKGTHTSRSDVDLALFGTISPLRAQAVASELDDLPLPYKFDVQVFEGIQADALKDHIRRVGIPLYPNIDPQLQEAEGGDSAEAIEACFRDILTECTDTFSTLREASPERLRALVTLALQEANGSYKEVARLFHVSTAEYRRFMDLLRRKGCVIDFRPFRKMPVPVS